MSVNKETEFYDLAIIGAGPAGCTCALALKDAGLKVLLIDKAMFPRDKVCGDAIPGRAIKILKSMSPEYGAAFANFPHQYKTLQTKIFFNKQELCFTWVQEAYTCTRFEFDNFLFNLVKQNTNTTILTDTQIEGIEQGTNSISFTANNKSRSYCTKILVGADGAHSIVAKQLSTNIINRKHYGASVRAYYENVADMNANTNEVYYDKDFLPSYLWVFPLPGNKANVGFGMVSAEIVKRKINLKKTFSHLLKNTPELSLKFKDAIQIGSTEGFGLPFGSNFGKISGNRILLAGDAASLIDPINGDGIGNAMASGKLAALQIVKCFNENNFSDTYIKNYDKTVLDAIGKELKAHYRIQRILTRMPYLLFFLFWISKYKPIKKWIQKMI